MATKDPTTANPAMTPPLSEDPCEPSVEVEFDVVVSMTAWLTHSPNVQLASCSPADPKTLVMTACLKAQDVEPLESGASQDISTLPERPLRTAERSVRGTAPQNVELAKQVHLRFWQFQSELPVLSPRSCVHVSAVQ